MAQLEVKSNASLHLSVTPVPWTQCPLLASSGSRHVPGSQTCKQSKNTHTYKIK